jgi:hypothetical protein
MMPEQNPSTQAPSNNVGTTNSGQLVAAQATIQPAMEWAFPKPALPTLPAPIPLTNTRKADYVGFPEVSFPIVLKDAIEAIADNVKLPIEIAGASILGAASYVAQSHVDVINPKGIQSPTSIFMLSVGMSGERKSASDSAAMKPIEAFQQQLKASYESQMKHYRDNYDGWKRQRDLLIAAKDVSLADRMAKINTLPPEPTKPLHYKILVSNPTIEGVTTQLAIGWPSVGVFSDEASIFIGGFSMNKDNMLHTIGMFSKLWDKGTADRTRKAAEDSYTLTGRRVATHLLIQPTIAEEFLANKAMRGQGILARFLISWPESNIGNRFIEDCELDDKLWDDPRMKRYFDKMVNLLQKTWAFKPDNQQELVPTVLELEPDAKDLWRSAHNWIEQEMQPGRQYESIKAFASKMLENALRIAGVFQFFINEQAATINKECLYNAFQLMTYYAYQQVEVMGNNDYDERTRRAINLKTWIQDTWQAGLADIISYSDLTTYAPREVRFNSGVLREAIDMLEKHNWLLKKPDALKKRKNESDMWIIQR